MLEVLYWLALIGAFILLVNIFAKRSKLGGHPNIPPYVPPSPLPFDDDDDDVKGKKLPIDDSIDKEIA